MQYDVDVNGQRRQVTIQRTTTGFVVQLDGKEWQVDATRVNPHAWSLLVGHASHEVALAPDPASGQLAVHVDGIPVGVGINSRRRWGRTDHAAAGSGPQRLTAPMPGKVVRILVQVGDTVQARQPLAVIEAMKMENELRAVRGGVVTDVQAKEGQSVDAGALLLIVSPA